MASTQQECLSLLSIPAAPGVGSEERPEAPSGER